MWTRNKRKWTGKDGAPGDSQRTKKERETEEGMGRQHHRMDRTHDGRGAQTCRRQGRMETTGFQLIIGAPTATAMG